MVDAIWNSVVVGAHADTYKLLQTPYEQYDKKVTELDAKTKQSKEELDKLLPKIGNLVDDTCVHKSINKSCNIFHTFSVGLTNPSFSSLTAASPSARTRRPTRRSCGPGAPRARATTSCTTTTSSGACFCLAYIIGDAWVYGAD